MIVALEIQDEGNNEYDLCEDEVEVDTEGELIRVLEEIIRLKKKNEKQKEILIMYVKEEHKSKESSLQLNIARII